MAIHICTHKISKVNVRKIYFFLILRRQVGIRHAVIPVFGEQMDSRLFFIHSEFKASLAHKTTYFKRIKQQNQETLSAVTSTSYPI